MESAAKIQDTDMPRFSDQPLYLAIGQPLGVMPGGAECGIRVGGTFFHLPLEGYELWHLALGGSTAADLVATAREQGADRDLDDNLRFFRHHMLLVAWHPSNSRALASRLRLRPTAMGGGLDGADPARFVLLSRAGTPACRVDFLSYVLWSYCDGVNSLEEAAQAAAAHCQVPLDVMLERADRLVPLLMRHGLALLDVAR
jgi:hypothetical protein